MNDFKKGDFYQIKFLDFPLVHGIIEKLGLRDQELICGTTYSAILEDYLTCNSEPYTYTFMIMGEQHPIIEVVINHTDILKEKVWIKKIDISPQVLSMQIPDDLDSINKLIYDIEHNKSEVMSSGRAIMEKLRDRQEDLVAERLKPLVGKYFKYKIRDSAKYEVIKVLDVPRSTFTMMDRVWHPWEIPVMRICYSPNGEINHMLRKSYVCSDAYKNGIEDFNKMYEEISEEVFNEELLKMIHDAADNYKHAKFF